MLLVDDDVSVAEMYQMGLEARGFEVTIAGDAAGLFWALEDEVPAILVLDYNLPGALGDQVLEMLRSDHRGRELPVFMLSNFSAASLDGAIDRVFQLGAIAWLEKTKTPPSLLADKLEEALAPARGKAFKV